MANSPEEAKQAIITAGLPEFYFSGTGIMAEDEIVYPRVYEGPVGTFVFGGK